MKNKMNGLLALLGLGAVAYYKYKNSSPEQQQAVKDKINNAKDNLSRFGNDLKSKANDLANQAQSKINEAQSSVENTMNQS